MKAQLDVFSAAQPSAQADRLTWMTWEGLWKEAASKQDEKALSLLIGSGINTPEKQVAASLVFEQWSYKPSLYDGKLMRLLLRGGVNIHDIHVPHLCGQGEKVISLIEKHGANLAATNLAGENGFQFIVAYLNGEPLKKAWHLLREAGVDPNHMDMTLENAFSAAENYGKIVEVYEIDDAWQRRKEAKTQGETLDRNTPTMTKGKRGKRL